MGLPAKLKDFNIFNDGNSYMGKVTEVTLPKLTRKVEEYIAAGMSGPISIDLHQEAIALEWTAGGLIVDAIRQWAAGTHNAVQLRFTGAYQSDDDPAATTVEIVLRGRHTELDMGTAKKGGDTEQKYKTACSYYKLTVAGEELIEFDFLAGIEKIGGVDRRASIMKAIGL
jgi:P2 family phage contractile tail tube protein